MIQGELPITHYLISPGHRKHSLFLSREVPPSVVFFHVIEPCLSILSLFWLREIGKDRMEALWFWMVWNRNHLFVPSSAGQQLGQGGESFLTAPHGVGWTHGWICGCLAVSLGLACSEPLPTHVWQLRETVTQPVLVFVHVISPYGRGVPPKGTI